MKLKYRIKKQINQCSQGLLYELFCRCVEFKDLGLLTVRKSICIISLMLFGHKQLIVFAHRHRRTEFKENHCSLLLINTENCILVSSFVQKTKAMITISGLCHTDFVFCHYRYWGSSVICFPAYFMLMIRNLIEFIINLWNAQLFLLKLAWSFDYCGTIIRTCFYSSINLFIWRWILDKCY